MDGRRGEAKSHKSGSSGSENLYKARRGVKSSNDPIRSSHPEFIRHRRIRFTAVSHTGLTQEAPLPNGQIILDNSVSDLFLFSSSRPCNSLLLRETIGRRMGREVCNGSNYIVVAVPQSGYPTQVSHGLLQCCCNIIHRIR